MGVRRVLEGYTPEQIEDIAEMILSYGIYMTNKHLPHGVPEEAEEIYERMTPPWIRKRVEKIAEEYLNIETLFWDE